MLPQDASCEDVDVDVNLGFLSSFVQTALQNGAAPYISEEDRFEMGAVRPTHQDNAADQTHALRFAAYESSAPAEPVTVRTISRDASPIRGKLLCSNQTTEQTLSCPPASVAVSGDYSAYNYLQGASC